MPSRRAFLGGTAALLLVRDALAQGKVQRGIHRIQGDVRVDGQPARLGAQIPFGAFVQTRADSAVVFVSGRDAFLVRKDSGLNLVKDGLRIVTGAVLSVFATGRRRTVETSTATIGIRGTGLYVEAEPERTYACTCYGVTVLEPKGDPASRETVRTRHHEQPRYIMASGAPQMIMQAPVVNHTDAELILLESIVGRQPPFIGQGYKPTY
jgi:hypothetical protein